MPNPTQEVPFRYLKVADLCEITQKGRSSIYRDIESGVLPKPTKIGGATRWRSDELVEFFNNLGGADK